MRVSQCLAAALLVAVTAAQSNVTCYSGLYVIVARASGEQPGYGILSSVKDSIVSRVANSGSTAVPYPATITNPIYFESEPEGVGNMTQIITQYGDACPDNKMALLGYSQGAQVIGDTLIGSAFYAFGASFPNTTGIDQKYINNVAAVVMMGDPSNVAGQPFLVGNSTMNGLFPRNNTADWASRGLVDKMKSYCDALDYFCDNGRAPNSLNVHIGYVLEYGTQAADFVVSKAMNGTNSTGSSSSSTTSSSSSATMAPTSVGGSGSSGSATTTAPGGATSTTKSGSAWSMSSGLSGYVIFGLFQCAVTLVLFS